MQELLLPTPANLNPIHVPRSDLLQFLRVQQWVEVHLSTKLPLLNGMFVLVSSGDLQQQQHCSDSIPWRLRQVSAVEVASHGDPADATVVLVGGDRVRAGAVREGLLAEMPDYQVSNWVLLGGVGSARCLSLLTSAYATARDCNFPCMLACVYKSTL